MRTKRKLGLQVINIRFVTESGIGRNSLFHEYNIRALSTLGIDVSKPLGEMSSTAHIHTHIYTHTHTYREKDAFFFETFEGYYHTLNNGFFLRQVRETKC